MSAKPPDLKVEAPKLSQMMVKYSLSCYIEETCFQLNLV